MQKLVYYRKGSLKLKSDLVYLLGGKKIQYDCVCGVFLIIKSFIFIIFRFKFDIIYRYIEIMDKVYFI